MNDITTNFPKRPRPHLADPLPPMSLEPRPQVPVFLRQKSQRVAQAEQDFEDLENALAASVREVGDLRNRNNLIEESNKILHEEIIALKRERDQYQRDNTAILTKLRVAGSIILDAMNQDIGPAAYAPPGSTAKLAAAVERIEDPHPHSFQQGEGAPDDGAERIARKYGAGHVDDQ